LGEGILVIEEGFEGEALLGGGNVLEEQGITDLLDELGRAFHELDLPLVELLGGHLHVSRADLELEVERR
jgi:hypothetical protein